MRARLFLLSARARVFSLFSLALLRASSRISRRRARCRYASWWAVRAPAIGWNWFFGGETRAAVAESGHGWDTFRPDEDEIKNMNYSSSRRFHSCPGRRTRFFFFIHLFGDSNNESSFRREIESLVYILSGPRCMNEIARVRNHQVPLSPSLFWECRYE